MKEIEKIIAAYQHLDTDGEAAALGTVVKVEGSAYRRIGARMFVRNNGMWTGGISGGCLEGDALRQAQKAMMKQQSSIVVYDTTEDDPNQIGVGLGCQGRIEVLFTPIDPANPDNQIEFLKTIVNRRETTILLQTINTQGGDPGLRHHFYTKTDIDQLANAISIQPGILYEQVQLASRRRKSNVFSITNPAGQVYEILAELIHPKIKLICVGDNYDVHAMLEVTQVLGWETHVVGKMRKMGRQFHQKAHRVYDLNNIDQIAIDDFTAVVLMSHDYRTDLDMLTHLLDKDVPYIGLLGPKKRMQKMQDELDETGATTQLAALPHLHSPVGLDIGSESPEEIALAIVAEIIAHFRSRNGTKLKYRADTIHERAMQKPTVLGMKFK